MGCLLFRYSCSKIFVIPLFLLKNFHYSIIPPKNSTHYSIIPRTKFPLFLFRYSSSAPEIHVNNSKIAQYFLSDNKALLQIVTFNFSPDIDWEKGVGCKLKYPPQVITFLPEFLWYVRMS